MHFDDPKAFEKSSSLQHQTSTEYGTEDKNAANNSNTLVIIAIIFIFHSVSFTMLFPVTPKLILTLVGNNSGHAATVTGWVVAVAGFLKFISNPAWGVIADKYGRKYTLMLALLAHSIPWLVIGIYPSLTTLIVCKMVTGSMDCSYAIGYTILGDISGAGKCSSNTTKQFGVLGACFGVGLVVGPALGGYLSTIQEMLPFFIASGLNFVGMVMGLIFLNETLPYGKISTKIKKINPFSTICLVLHDFRLLLVCVPFFLITFASGIHNIWFLYTNYRYGWTEFQNGLFLSYIGVLITCVQAFVLRWCVPSVVNEKNAVILGCTFQSCAFFGIALATNDWLIYISAILLAAHGISMPSIRSICTQLIDLPHQGVLQGGMGGISTLAMILSGPTFGEIFRASVSSDLRQEYPKKCPDGYDTTHIAHWKVGTNCGGVPAVSYFIASIVCLFAVIMSVLILKSSLLNVKDTEFEDDNESLCDFERIE